MGLSQKSLSDQNPKPQTPNPQNPTLPLLKLQPVPASGPPGCRHTSLCTAPKSSSAVLEFRGLSGLGYRDVHGLEGLQCLEGFRV